jgi:hypothetical protein
MGNCQYFRPSGVTATHISGFRASCFRCGSLEFRDLSKTIEGSWSSIESSWELRNTRRQDWIHDEANVCAADLTWGFVVGIEFAMRRMFAPRTWPGVFDGEECPWGRLGRNGWWCSFGKRLSNCQPRYLEYQCGLEEGANNRVWARDYFGPTSSSTSTVDVPALKRHYFKGPWKHHLPNKNIKIWQYIKK